jgi:hypothetical protein
MTREGKISGRKEVSCAPPKKGSGTVDLKSEMVASWTWQRGEALESIEPMLFRKL